MVLGKDFHKDGAAKLKAMLFESWFIARKRLTDGTDMTRQ